MIYTNLRKVGGSTMLALPPVLLRELNLNAGQTVSLYVQDGKLWIEAKKKPSYQLADLLAEQATLDLAHDAWDNVYPVGREQI